VTPEELVALRQAFDVRLVAHLNGLAEQHGPGRLGSFGALAEAENELQLIIDVEPENEGDVPWKI